MALVVAAVVAALLVVVPWVAGALTGEQALIAAVYSFASELIVGLLAGAEEKCSALSPLRDRICWADALELAGLPLLQYNTNNIYIYVYRSTYPQLHHLHLYTSRGFVFLAFIPCCRKPEESLGFPAIRSTARKC